MNSLEVGDRVLDDLGQVGAIKAIEQDEQYGKTYWVCLDWRPHEWFPYPVEELAKPKRGKPTVD